MFWLKRKPKPLWFERYDSTREIMDPQDRIFLSYYTEDAFNSILGEDMRYFVNSRYKLYVSEVLEAVKHYINTGDVKYFYQHGQGN